MTEIKQRAKATVVRTGFNNNNWSGKCTNAHHDKRLFKCQNKIIFTGFQIDKNGKCKANCSEQKLCTDYVWGGWGDDYKKAQPEQEAFFVFPDLNNKLVLWGHSIIKSVDGNTIYFKPFKPMPQEYWTKDLSGEEITGSKWGSGICRYIYDDKQLNSLKQLLNQGINTIKYEDDVETQPLHDNKEDSIEWRRRLRKHLSIERQDSRIIQQFKSQLSSSACSICGFNFEKIYGEIGIGFIEAHHLIPVSKLKKGQIMTKEYLVAICSNCHRMIHRSDPMLTPTELKRNFTK